MRRRKAAFTRLPGRLPKAFTRRSTSISCIQMCNRPLGVVKVRGSSGGDQVPDLFRVESRIDDREGPPQAHPHEIHLGNPMPAADKFHVIHIAVDMVIQGEKLISAGRGAPFNEIDLHPFLEEIVDDTPVRLEVQQGFPVKQSVHQQQRGFETGRFRPVIFSLTRSV